MIVYKYSDSSFGNMFSDTDSYIFPRIYHIE